MTVPRYRYEFIQTAEAWYSKTFPAADRIVDEVGIAVYDVIGGRNADFAIRWHDLSIPIAAPRLEMFDDAWWALDLAPVGRLLAGLARAGRPLSRLEVVVLLLDCGFVDVTDRTGPEQPDPVVSEYDRGFLAGLVLKYGLDPVISAAADAAPFGFVEDATR